MGRPATGDFIDYTRADGSRSFAARVSAYGSRYRVALGDEHGGVTRPMAEAELHRILGEIRHRVAGPGGSERIPNAGLGRASAVTTRPAFGSGPLLERTPRQRQRVHGSVSP